MKHETSGDNSHGPSPMELQPASQATLSRLFKVAQARYQAMQYAGQDSFEVLAEDDEQRMMRIHCHDDGDGRMEYDFAGLLASDTSGRYKFFAPNWYKDTSVRASINKIEPAKEPELDGEEFITTYTITALNQLLSINRQVSRAGRLRWTVLGELPMFDDEPMISLQEHQLRRQQEDAFGINFVPESEAIDLLDLISPSGKAC